ncbi:MAG: DUF4124 domain-containing protein [Chromatiaceae bacterium]|nr:DUF4124 domain-containing protein [Chromatiaceae bacterium]
MKTQRRVTITTIALFCTFTATAQTVYKSVDADGKVTYSAAPPPDAAAEMVEKVPIAPGPTDQQRSAAENRTKELESVTESAEQEREAQDTESAEAASSAEQELRRARIALQEAQIQGDDDWQYLASGGRVLKQSYLDGVAEAKRRVQEAEKALRSARSGRR